VSSRNAPLGDAMVVVVVLLVVIVGATVVVVLPQTNEPSGEPAPQESQQLAAWAAHAWPPFGGLHLLALDLIEHFTLPRRSMRQQVIAPTCLLGIRDAAHVLTAVGRVGTGAFGFDGCGSQAAAMVRASDDGPASYLQRWSYDDGPSAAALRSRSSATGGDFDFSGAG